MKIFNSSQIKCIEEYTCLINHITSLDLMENAAISFCEEFKKLFPYDYKIIVISGFGNNGGDALAIARILSNYYNNIAVYLYKFNHKLSDDCNTNLQKLYNYNKVKITIIENEVYLPSISPDDIVIDGLFGCGLNKPIEFPYLNIINHVNNFRSIVVSVDIPSGLHPTVGKINNSKNIIKANYTITFQFPKYSFFFSDFQDYVGQWSIVDIGLVETNSFNSNYLYVEEEYIASLLKKRKKYDHKGLFGHGLLVAGSKGMAGAALLSAKASMKSGIGKLTIFSSAENRLILQLGIPEAMFTSFQELSKVNKDILKYTAIAVGPGLGLEENNDLLMKFMDCCNRPMVLDADALNIIANNKELLCCIPENSILTPHRGEFFRLFGKPESEFEEITTAKNFASKYRIIIVLKGAYSRVVLPDGHIYFNSTGNPGMATAGSGDVLTGTILSLLCQGYSPCYAAIIGVFIHGYAGDLAIKKLSQNFLVASDIIDFLPQAFYNLNKRKICWDK